MLEARTEGQRTLSTPTRTVGAPGEVIIIRAGGSYDGKQGMTLATGVSSRSTGARGLCLHLVTIPPGTRGVPHVHNGHESAIYTVSGETEVWHGEGLRHRAVVTVWASRRFPVRPARHPAPPGEPQRGHYGGRGRPHRPS
jgi:hypothetical protein